MFLPCPGSKGIAMHHFFGTPCINYNISAFISLSFIYQYILVLIYALSFIYWIRPSCHCPRHPYCAHFYPMPNQAFGGCIIPELISRRSPCSINTSIETQLNYEWFLSHTFIDSHFLLTHLHSTHHAAKSITCPAGRC